MYKRWKFDSQSASPGSESGPTPPLVSVVPPQPLLAPDTTALPMDPRVISSLLQSVRAGAVSEASLSDRAVALSVIIGFALCLRPISLVRLRVKDVVLVNSCLRVSIWWEKTRIRESRPRVKYSLSLPPFLTSFISDFLRDASADDLFAGHGFLFPQPRSASISDASASSAKARLVDCIRVLVGTVFPRSSSLPFAPHPEQFAGYSLRRGGTSAATALGFSPSEIDRLVNWRSADTQQAYVWEIPVQPGPSVASLLASFFKVTSCPVQPSPLADELDLPSLNFPMSGSLISFFP